MSNFEDCSVIVSILTSRSGVEVFTNSSASHFSLQKLNIRIQIITEATRKAGGLYLFSNCQGEPISCSVNANH